MNDILDSRIDKPIDLGDVDELSVQVAPLGEFLGSDIKGNAIPEKLSEEALIKLAEKLNESGEEILCDIDHASTRLGCEKDSKAAGWFSQFFVSPIKGLWAKIKLTTLGKKLVEDREYRFLSPVFSLNENGEPVDLHSVAFTNVPAFKNHIQPILNSESNEILINDEKDILSMTKDELKELIISTISEMKVAEEKAEAVEEIKEEIKETEVVKEDVENTTCETTEEIKNEESTEKTEVVEKTTEEKPVEETEKVEEKEEVIKIEALNSSPSIIKDVEPIWKKLKGKEFLDWASKNKNYQI